MRERQVVVFGRRAWNALGFREEDYFSSVIEQLEGVDPEHWGPRFWLLPDPWRRPSIWKNPESRERARRLLRDIVSDRIARGYSVIPSR
jgi:hypothetical protein